MARHGSDIKNIEGQEVEANEATAASLTERLRQSFTKIRSWFLSDQGGVGSITALFFGRDTKEDNLAAGNLAPHDSADLALADVEGERAWDEEQRRVEEEFEREYAVRVAEERAEYLQLRDKQKKREAYEEAEIKAGRGRWDHDIYNFMSGRSDKLEVANLDEDRIAEAAQEAGLSTTVSEEENPSYVRDEFKPKIVQGINSGVPRADNGVIMAKFDPEKNLLAPGADQAAGKPKREEYKPGSHKPAPKEPGRDKDDKSGRGD